MRRIGNGIKYSILFVANLLMLFFLHSYFNLLILIFMLILPGISVAAAVYAAKNLRLSFSGAKERFGVENPFGVKLVLTNPTWIPLLNVNLTMTVHNLFMQHKDSHVLNVPAYARKEQETQYMLKSDDVGVLQVDADHVRVMDWLGFVAISAPCQARYELVLMPEQCVELEPDMTAVSSGMTECEESRQRGQDFTEVQDVREYQPGDKLQNIHWKLSAKKDMLMVKDRVSMSSQRLLLVVELYQDESAVLNRIVTAAYGVAVFLLQQQIPYELLWWSSKRQDMRRCVVENADNLAEWMEMLFYEEYYVQPGLAQSMMSRLLQENMSYLVIGCAGMEVGESVVSYGADVEGYLCRL